MKIESIIKRIGGTRVTMQDPTVAYHFRPIDPENQQSPHIAEVTENAHISRFLSIKEGFQYAGETKPAEDRPPLAETVAPEPTPAPAPAPEPDAVTPPEPAPAAAEALPDATTEGEPSGEAGPVSETDPETETAPDEVVPPAALNRVLDDPDNASREDAEEAFEFLEDRKPNAKSKTETIVKKVIEKATDDGWLSEGGEAGALAAATE